MDAARALHRSRARQHAMRRAWQRFGMATGHVELGKIEQRIVGGDADWIQDLRGLRQAYRIKLRGRVLTAIWDIRLWCVVTLLPVGWRL